MKKKYFRSLAEISTYERENKMKFAKIFQNYSSEKTSGEDKYVAYYEN